MRYLKKIDDGYVYPFTEMLALRTDMVECDELGVQQVPSAQVASNSEPKEPDEPVLEPQNMAMAIDIPPAGGSPDELEGEELSSYLRTLQDKTEVEAYAKKRWEVDLDRRKSAETLIAECVEMANG